LSSSTEFTASPPQANTILSMFLRLALRKAMMPALANISRQMGSMPFSLMTTKLVPLLSPFSSVVAFSLSSMILRHL